MRILNVSRSNKPNSRSSTFILYCNSLHCGISAGGKFKKSLESMCVHIKIHSTWTREIQRYPIDPPMIAMPTDKNVVCIKTDENV